MYRIGLLFLIALALLAVFSPILTPFDPNKQSLADNLIPPGGKDKNGLIHMLGTDFLGRDVLSRLIYGPRVSLLMAACVVIFACIIGTLAGLISGYFGGLADMIIMRIADIQLALPFMLLAIAVMAALGPGLNKMVLVLILVTWAIYARLVRGIVLTVKEKEFVKAARSVGSPTWWILLRHVLPNVLDKLIVVATLETAQMVIAEAALSYLGLGVQPPTASWGSMLSDGRNYLYTAWWLTALPGAATFITVLSINIVGTELRDRMDPKAKRVKGRLAVSLSDVS